MTKQYKSYDEEFKKTLVTLWLKRDKYFVFNVYINLLFM